MSGELSIFVVIAIVVVAIGLQIIARQLQRYPAYSSRADPLIEVTRSKSVNARPAELHQLVGVIAKSLLSDASERAELQPILDELHNTGPGSPASTGDSNTRRRGLKSRGKRARRIEEAIAELESDWGLDQEA